MSLVKSVSAETLAYTAGLFDGEGCVNFSQSGQAKTLFIRVMIRNTDYGIMEFLQSAFGGQVSQYDYSKNPTWKTSYCWRLDWDSAMDFLCAIEPWVRIKAEQILVAKVWGAIRNRGGKKLTDDYRSQIDLLAKQLHWLNRKCKRLESDIEPIAEVLTTLSVPAEQILEEIGYAAH